METAFILPFPTSVGELYTKSNLTHPRGLFLPLLKGRGRSKGAPCIFDSDTSGASRSGFRKVAESRVPLSGPEPLDFPFAVPGVLVWLWVSRTWTLQELSLGSFYFLVVTLVERGWATRTAARVRQGEAQQQSIVRRSGVLTVTLPVCPLGTVSWCGSARCTSLLFEREVAELRVLLSGPEPLDFPFAVPGVLVWLWVSRTWTLQELSFGSFLLPCCPSC